MGRRAGVGNGFAAGAWLRSHPLHAPAPLHGVRRMPCAAPKPTLGGLGLGLGGRVLLGLLLALLGLLLSAYPAGRGRFGRRLEPRPGHARAPRAAGGGAARPCAWTGGGLRPRPKPPHFSHIPALAGVMYMAAEAGGLSPRRRCARARGLGRAAVGAAAGPAPAAARLCSGLRGELASNQEARVRFRRCFWPADRASGGFRESLQPLARLDRSLLCWRWVQVFFRPRVDKLRCSGNPERLPVSSQFPARLPHPQPPRPSSALSPPATATP
jgi:hypothetical protein